MLFTLQKNKKKTISCGQIQEFAPKNVISRRIGINEIVKFSNSCEKKSILKKFKNEKKKFN